MRHIEILMKRELTKDIINVCIFANIIVNKPNIN